MMLEVDSVRHRSQMSGVCAVAAVSIIAATVVRMGKFIGLCGDRDDSFVHVRESARGVHRSNAEGSSLSDYEDAVLCVTLCELVEASRGHGNRGKE